MKRFFVLLIAFVLFIGVIPVFAAGKLSVEKENFIVIDSYSIYGYAYAKVKNVGDKPIKINAGLLEIFDSEGDTITSDDYLSAYAEYLQPDEYTYVSMYESIDNVESASEVDDYMLTITGKSDVDKISLRIPVTDTKFEPNVNEGYWTYNYMYATVTNNTEETLFDISVITVLLDDEDNILYMENENMYRSKGLAPGSSIVIRADVSSSFIEYYESHGYTPTKVDAIAYVNIDAE